MGVNKVQRSMARTKATVNRKDAEDVWLLGRQQLTVRGRTTLPRPQPKLPLKFIDSLTPLPLLPTRPLHNRGEVPNSDELLGQRAARHGEALSIR